MLEIEVNSQSTVLSLISCKNLSIRLLLWSRKCYFIIDNHRSHFLSKPLPPVGPLRELVINDVNFSLQLEIMCSQFRKKDGTMDYFVWYYCLWWWCQLFSRFTYCWGHSRTCNACHLGHSERRFKLNLF